MCLLLTQLAYPAHQWNPILFLEFAPLEWELAPLSSHLGGHIVRDFRPSLMSGTGMTTTTLLKG